MHSLIINSRFGSKLLAAPLPRFPPACGGQYVVHTFNRKKTEIYAVVQSVVQTLAAQMTHE